MSWEVGDSAVCIKREPWKACIGTLPEKMPQYGEVCTVIDVWDDPIQGTVLALSEYQPHDYPTSESCVVASGFQKVREGTEL